MSRRPWLMSTIIINGKNKTERWKGFYEAKFFFFYLINLERISNRSDGSFIEFLSYLCQTFL